jgi:hypothetical protein
LLDDHTPFGTRKNATGTASEPSFTFAVMTTLDEFDRVPLLFGPSPIHPLPRLSAALGGDVEIWAKREDCNSRIAFGSNKVRNA